MTTITIEQSLLEQALNALLLPCDRWNKQQFLIVKGAIESLNAALVAPATAPAWHVAPTVPGLWVSDFSWMAQKLDRETVEFYAKNRSIPSRRWYGPIPEDKP
mgnify:CR=1 FL=1